MIEGKATTTTIVSTAFSTSSEAISLKKIRAAIPEDCFESEASTSLFYISRDVFYSASLCYLASYIPLIESGLLRALSWNVYGFAQGIVFVGIWMIAHECGHQALFKHQLLNDGFGLALHSFTLTPYFSWKYSHGLHHRYTNHMEKDTVFVPSTESDPRIFARIKKLLHIGEDAPIVNLMFLAVHQLIGFPLYVVSHASSGLDSGGRAREHGIADCVQNHLNPYAELFLSSQRLYILISDLALVIMGFALRYGIRTFGVSFMLGIYFVPYIWMNHWIVAITYLHHHHPSAQHFGAEAWNFQEGALSTVDRDFGFIGRHFFHCIVEWHVVHHLFSKIPFYKAERATDAIKPLLGSHYHRDNTPFMNSLWNTFTRLQYVIPKDQGSQIFIWAP